MTDDEFAEKREHYDSEVERYDEAYFGDDGYEPLLLARDIVVDALNREDAEGLRILDMGCGNGGIMVSLLDAGHDVYGFDLSPNMVESGKTHLAERDYDPERVVQFDVRDGVPFDGPFDAVVAVGLLPHLDHKARHLATIRDLLVDGGSAVVQFRNSLFSLFSYNEYTYEFVWGTLLSDINPPERLSAAFDERLREICRLESGTGSRPKCDQEGGFSNPLTIDRAFDRAGMSVDDLQFYHYHPFPPRFEDEYPDAYTGLAADLEDPMDWRGHFLASSFIVIASH